jgi:rare lipoprotein A
MRVGLVSKARSTSAEELRLGEELNVHLEADHGFPIAVRASHRLRYTTGPAALLAALWALPVAPVSIVGMGPLVGMGCRRPVESPEPTAAVLAPTGYAQPAPLGPGLGDPGHTGDAHAPPPGPVFQHGKASYYADSLAQRPTASGEPYDPSAWTAAHRSLPFGTWVWVERTDNGRAVLVRINDRGPFAGKNRVIDLSGRAADQLDMKRAGVVDVVLRKATAPTQ